MQIDKYKKQENVKTGLIPILFIYFKMRSNCWSVIKPEVENKKSVADKNAYVKEMKQKNQAERDSLEKNNPWLKEKGVLLDFSGVSLNENIYHRYWYGSIRC